MHPAPSGKQMPGAARTPRQGRDRTHPSGHHQVVWPYVVASELSDQGRALARACRLRRWSEHRVAAADDSEATRRHGGQEGRCWFAEHMGGLEGLEGRWFAEHMGGLEGLEGRCWFAWGRETPVNACIYSDYLISCCSSPRWGGNK